MTAWLLTWLWQGSALAAGVAITLRLAPQRNAATRHFTSCAALAAVAWLGWASSPYRRVPGAAASASDPIYIPPAPDFLLMVFIGIWAAIALVMLLRAVRGLKAVGAARDRCRPFPPAIEATLPLWLEANGRGRRTELMLCDAVPGATVLGFNNPCIAIPSSLVGALRCDELDQVILHEHAHVQRRDDWSQLALTLMQAVLWVHPAVLFLSRALSREREMACDEWVVARTGSPKAYARCLARAADVRALTKGGSTVEPALISSRHELVRRVDRILALNARGRRRVSLLGATAAASALAAMSAQLQSVPGFAELADIVLPPISGPVASLYPATMTRPDMAGTGHARVRLKPDTPIDSTRDTTLDAPIASNPPAAPALVAPPEVIAPVAAIAPVVTGLTARVYAGVYSSSTPQDASAADSPNRWNALATPGVEIAATAKKTGLRVANGFSRAGVSLARRF